MVLNLVTKLETFIMSLLSPSLLRLFPSNAVTLQLVSARLISFNPHMVFLAYLILLTYTTYGLNGLHPNETSCKIIITTLVLKLTLWLWLSSLLKKVPL